MKKDLAEVVICGAGIAGICAAYYLSVKQGVKDILLVDERAPFSLTSDKSTECYRNWWPGPGDAMVKFMNRSIDLMEGLAHESGNRFHMNRRGYLFVTAERGRIEAFKKAAEQPCALGAGPLRIHETGSMTYQPSPVQGYANLPTGADLILDPELIKKHFPFLDNKVVAALHVRRCGWMSAQQLAMYMLEQAKEAGVRFQTARVEDVEVQENQVQAVLMNTVSGPLRIDTQCFVNAAGPFVKEVAADLNVDLPVFCELHDKISFNDNLGVIPREAPLIFWADPQRLPWSDDEHKLLDETAETKWLLEPFPSGPHGHPEGGSGSHIQLVLWTYDVEVMEPVIPPPEPDPHYFEVVLRGLSRMVPGLRAYFEKPPKPFVDGGYYAKTQENRPLIGPLPVKGAYVIGALSGFGIMAGCAAGELLAAHLTQSELPDYAQWFLLERYGDPEYQKLLKDWDASGQL